MTRKQYRQLPAGVKEALEGDPDLLRPMVEGLVQQVLEAVGAGRYGRSEGRLGYRSGYYPRGLVTRVGQIELRAP